METLDVGPVGTAVGEPDPLFPRIKDSGHAGETAKCFICHIVSIDPLNSS